MQELFSSSGYLFYFDQQVNYNEQISFHKVYYSFTNNYNIKVQSGLICQIPILPVNDCRAGSKRSTETVDNTGLSVDKLWSNYPETVDKVFVNVDEYVYRMFITLRNCGQIL